MAVIKLVEGIWTFQKRKESADEIAEAGRKLYEKLTNFAQSFVNVGRAIKQSSDAFEQAQGQLSHRQGKCNQAGGGYEEAGRDAGARQADAAPAVAAQPEDEDD